MHVALACTVRVRLVTGVIAIAMVTVVSGWLLAAAASGTAPEGDYRPRRHRVHLLEGPDAETRRQTLLRMALPREAMPELTVAAAAPSLPADHPLQRPLPACRFIAEPATGTSAKFECSLGGGEVVKVKYGRNAEIHAETAATLLLTMLGYPADHVIIVPRLRCYGCPRFPFLTMKLLSLATATGVLMPYGYEAGYTDFENVAAERRFPAPAVETPTQSGWAWWELKNSEAPRAELDALRLLAVFLAHWDNKADNQRLVCAGDSTGDDNFCQPLLMLQDVGATFGPTKANLARWRDLPVWADRASCLVSMSALPSYGATFPDAWISEEGRLLLARRLARLSDADVRGLFEDARFHEFYGGTNDERDLDAWTEAFRHRADQIAHAGPCPTAS